MKKNVIKYLEFSCSRFPGKTAVIDEAESLTYAELLRRSRIIGSAIARRSQPRSPVPVLMDKSAVALSAFLGIAYADCFYVLLNPELPAARLEQIREVLDAQWVITDDAHRETALALFPADRVLTADALLSEEEDAGLLARPSRTSIPLWQWAVRWSLCPGGCSPCPQSCWTFCASTK